SASPLTPRTEERRPVAQDDPLDRRPADPARLAFAAVDLEERLEAAGLARRVAVIPERRAPDPDRGLEDVADRVPEPRRLVGAERVRGAVRPDPGAEERLVRVDVADPHDVALVQEPVPDRRPGPLRPRVQPLRGERLREGLY